MVLFDIPNTNLIAAMHYSSDGVIQLSVKPKLIFTGPVECAGYEICETKWSSLPVNDDHYCDGCGAFVCDSCIQRAGWLFGSHKSFAHVELST